MKLPADATLNKRLLAAELCSDPTNEQSSGVNECTPLAVSGADAVVEGSPGREPCDRERKRGPKVGDSEPKHGSYNAVMEGPVYTYLPFPD